MMFCNNSKIHYYGWDRIQQKIQDLNHKILIIDYVDIYFLSHQVKLIEKDWVGIIHHTSSTFSDNNINNLFKRSIFVNSLKHCKGLIVLSVYNKKNLEIELGKLHLRVNIYVLKHPTPPTFNKTFNIHLFEKNLNIYNIGGWLRNPYTIYHAQFMYNNKPLTKYKLKGYSMNQYFPSSEVDYDKIANKIINYKDLDSKDFIANYNESYSDKLYEFHHNPHLSKTKINNINNVNVIIDNILEYSHPNNSINYYITYLIHYLYELFSKNKNISNDHIAPLLYKNHNSVKEIEYVPNDTYLDLLISNIVFCDYIDCSASNTIVECIATGTPIIVNRHPAVEEYLGKDYPLYFDKIYDDETDTYNLNSKKLLNGHHYLLQQRNKNNLELNHFINELENIIKNIILKKIKKKKKKFIIK